MASFVDNTNLAIDFIQRLFEELVQCLARRSGFWRCKQLAYSIDSLWETALLLHEREGVSSNLVCGCIRNRIELDTKSGEGYEVLAAVAHHYAVRHERRQSQLQSFLDWHRRDILASCCYHDVFDAAFTKKMFCSYIVFNL